ncbi:RNA-directed DNA polymerase from mobile element jockey-like [Rhizophagus irregularis DAOM 181602=DAOM 197198]|nr:RNA-directed DNA polymerase from mobile element jockey-like [Rhizophagus irregularis DAOM 181602=DAOM 197198]
MNDNIDYDTFVRNPPNSVDFSSFKMDQISSFFLQNHVSFGGIVDTHLSPKQMKFLSKRVCDYTSFHSDLDSTKHGRSSGGVSLFIHNSLATHVQFYQSHSSRILSVDLFFKGNVKLPSIFDSHDLHISDHNPIITYFDASLLSDAIKSARARQLGRNTRRVFKYDSISIDQWTAFADNLDKLCPIDPLIFDAWPLNQKCEYLHSRIIKAANSTLPSVTVGNTYIPKKPKDLESLCQSYRFLSKVAKTIRSLHKTPISYSMHYETKWSSYYIRLNNILSFYKQTFVTPITFPPFLRDARIDDFANLLQTLEIMTLLLRNAIDQEVIEHFQNFVPITSTPSSFIQDLPERWSNTYAPLADVSSAIFDSLMDPPTLDECPGPSMISYEMLKHLGPSASALLFSLICACLSDANIPDLWRQATVFPIPKPHEWKCQLKNTHPITLLEVIRKALVKLFYNRLAPLLASHHVLQGGNFAGLPRSSCRDPIITLEFIIHDSVVVKQPLWILSQDISKAFDSVDLSMLRFALQRLRLPQHAIQFLLSLFMSRSNRVITAHGPTPPYRVRIGIDQGEVISPLLWIIYLDPLLTVLKNEKKDPYRLVSPIASCTVSSASCSLDALDINNLVFMDDSTLISSSKEGMEHMLSITEEFYCLNNTSANHNKYVLATNAVAASRDLSPIAFNLLTSSLNSTTNITVTPIPMSSSFRFLGVWFNINGSRNFIWQQLKRECNSFSAILRLAKLTVQQVVYLYNTILIPKLDYRMQVTHLSEAECSTITSSVRALVKHKAKLSRSVPNVVLYLTHALGLINLFSFQQQSHFTNLFLLANSSSVFMKSLFNYRLRFIQFYCLIPISPLMVLDWTCWSSLLIFKQDYITNTLASLLSTPFRLSRADLSSVPDLTYPNGHTPIYQCLSLDVFKANLTRL